MIAQLMPARTILSLFSIVAILLLSCATQKLIGHYDEESLTFRSRAFHCELKLPNIAGWRAIQKKQGKSDIIFEAYHLTKLLYVFLAAESLNTDLEDYFLLLKLSNKLEQVPGYQFFGKNLETVNGRSALRFVYAAEVPDDDVGTQKYTYTNVLFRKYGINYRLIVYTLSEAFERKAAIVDQIVKGFRLTD